MSGVVDVDDDDDDDEDDGDEEDLKRRVAFSLQKFDEEWDEWSKRKVNLSGTDALELWRREKLYDKFKMLALVARVVLGVSASEIPCERLFSKTSRIMTFQRTLLGSEKVRELVLAKHNAELTGAFDVFH